MPTWPVPALPTRFATAHRVFVGRTAELALLDAAWDAVQAGAAQVVFVCGEPGSGKSHLAGEVARAAAHQGAAVLAGGCSPDPAVPYQPFVEAFVPLLANAAPDALAGLGPGPVRELGRIAPHLAQVRGSVRTGDHEYRRDLFDAVATLLAAVAAERPVVLVLEDIHWAPPATRLLLTHLARMAGPLRLLLVATLRDTAPERSPGLATLIADAYRAAHVHRIDLGGLEPGDVAAFVSAEGGVRGDAAAEAARLLHERTGGNPFFVRELWREVRLRGGVDALRAGTAPAPRTVRDTLEARISGFDPLTRGCLDLGAVLGEEFGVADVAAAGGHRPEAVLRAFDGATGYGLLRYRAEAGTFTFHHALVRQSLLEALPPSRSAELHAALARVVEERSAGDPAAAALVARLYDGARALGYEEPRLRHLTAAARHAEHGLAHEEAARWWARAAAAAGDGSSRDQALLAAADCHLLAGDFFRARRGYRQVTGSPDAQMAIRAAIGFEDASWRPGHEGGEPLELLSAALARLPEDANRNLRVRATAALGRAHAFCGHLEEARVLGTRALAMARATGDPALIAQALEASLVQSMTTPGTLALTHHRALELRRVAMATGDFDKLGPVGCSLALAAYMGGSLDGWRSGVDDIRLAAAKTGQPFWEWVVGCYDHCQAYLAGDFARAESIAEGNRRLGATFGSDDTDGPYGLQMFLVRRETGGLESVRPLIASQAPTAGTWLPGLLAAYTALGMDEPARRLLTSVLAELDETDQSTAIWPAVVVFLAESALHLGHTDVLRRIAPLLTPFDGFNLVVGQCVAVLGSANLLLARIHAALGAANHAERHFETALDSDERAGSVVHRAETLARFAAFLSARGRRGDVARAAELRREAHGLAAPRGHRRVLALLGDGNGRPQQAAVGELTAREREVLRLLAEGASNKQIGEWLFISQHTAANHVRSILEKTGAANRTQAAMLAAGSGLLTMPSGRA